MRYHVTARDAADGRIVEVGNFDNATQVMKFMSVTRRLEPSLSFMWARFEPIELPRSTVDAPNGSLR